MASRSESWGLVWGQIRGFLKTYQSLQGAFSAQRLQANLFRWLVQLGPRAQLHASYYNINVHVGLGYLLLQNIIRVME